MNVNHAQCHIYEGMSTLLPVEIKASMGCTKNACKSAASARGNSLACPIFQVLCWVHIPYTLLWKNHARMADKKTLTQ